MVCLDEETVLALCAGTLDASARAHADAHLASCDECRALVSTLVRANKAARPAGSSVERAIDALAATSIADDGAGGGLMGAPVSPGDVLGGRFVVERVLGAGGMGVVVAARHAQLGQRVALKFLLPAACEVPGAVARFLREGMAAARITSEHVARVLDTGSLPDGAPYLVLEYLDGEDLAQRIASRGPLPLETALEYLLQAGEAIAEAHVLGVVHGDLKPANLFLAHRADGSPLVKVLDFGISKIDGGSQGQLTSTSNVMGSPRYMSPEQMLSAKSVDARTDIWALGVLLYELLTAEPVWDADTIQGLCALIATAPPPKIRARVPAVPARVDEVLARCLAKDRDERYETVGDFARALTPVASPAARASIERITRLAARARGHGAQTADVVSPPTPARSVSWRWLGLGALVLGALAVGSVLVVTRGGDAASAVTRDNRASPGFAAGAASTAPPEPEPTRPGPSSEASALLAPAVAVGSLPAFPVASTRAKLPVGTAPAPAPAPGTAKVPSPAIDVNRALEDRK